MTARRFHRGDLLLVPAGPRAELQVCRYVGRTVDGKLRVYAFQQQSGAWIKRRLKDGPHIRPVQTKSL